MVHPERGMCPLETSGGTFCGGLGNAVASVLENRVFSVCCVMPLNFRVPVMKPRIRPKSVILGYTQLKQPASFTGNPRRNAHVLKTEAPPGFPGGASVSVQYRTASRGVRGGGGHPCRHDVHGRRALPDRRDPAGDGRCLRDSIRYPALPAARPCGSRGCDLR